MRLNLSMIDNKAVDKVLEHITLPFELHDYQKEDIIAACSNPFSYGFYHSMGLGKTVCATVVGVYKLLHGYDSVVLLCPASLIVQWVEWLESLDLDVLSYTGSPKKRKEYNFDHDFIVMSFNIFPNDYDRIVKEVTDSYYIVDEGTILCNTNNLLHKMLCGGMIERRKTVKIGNTSISVPKKIKYKKVFTGMLILTGTPINNPLDAYGLIKITSPSLYPNFYNFKRKHVKRVDEYKRPIEYSDLEDIHKALTENGVIRKVTDHLGLPGKVYKIIKYDLDRKHKALYNRLVEERLIFLEDGQMLDATSASKLYHTCQRFIFCPPDIKEDPAGLEVIDHVVAETDQRIIFSNYTDTNARIMKRYSAGGCYSGVSRKGQSKFISDFKAGKLDTLAIHPKSGGIGLNLQGCNQAIFAELPVTSNLFRQSEARVWRQGQKNTVVITILIARGTIQTTLLRKILEKDDIKSEALRDKDTLRKDLLGIK